MSTTPHGTDEQDASRGNGGGFAATLRRSVADRLSGGEQPATEAGAATAQMPAAGPREGTAGSAARAAVTGPRRVRLSLSRVDPWSTMKLAFLLSVGLGVMIVVAAAVVWFVLDAMHVFADIQELLVSVGSENFLRLMDYLQFDRVMSFATIVAVIDVLLLTALATIGAFLYNIVAALVGGLHVTLTDD